jgi:hypothetical protein
MEAAVREGLPIAAVAAGNCEGMQDVPAESFARHLQMLRTAGIGPYRPSQHIAPQRDVVVTAMYPGKTLRRAASFKTLSGREPFTQPLTVADGLSLYRIDLEASSPAGAAVRFHWAVVELDSKRQRRTRAQGTYAFDDRADPTFVRLVFEPLSLGPGSRLELRLSADDGPKAWLRVPQYLLPPGDPQQPVLRGFLFYERPKKMAAAARRSLPHR